MTRTYRGSQTDGASTASEVGLSTLDENTLRIIVEQFSDLPSLSGMTPNKQLRRLRNKHVMRLYLQPLTEEPFGIDEKKLYTAEEVSVSDKEISDQTMKTFAERVALGTEGVLAKCHKLTLSNNELSLNGFLYLTRALRQGALPNLISLELKGNRLGDDGIVSLSLACAKGALAKLEHLDLSRTGIEPDGIRSFALVITPKEEKGGGALVNCRTLKLGMNRIRDIGLEYLSNACAKGALAELRYLDLHRNLVAETGMASFANAITPKEKGGGGALMNCQTMLLQHNKIRNVGFASLAEACAKGALPQLERLELDFNFIGTDGMTSFAKAVTLKSKDGNRALGNCKKLILSMNDDIDDVGITALSNALNLGALPALEILYMGRSNPKLKAACSKRYIQLY